MKQETNKLKRAWIWFWYNDITRLLLIMFPGHLIFLLPILHWIGVRGEELGACAVILYIIGFVWAVADNDYTNLHRIGLTVYREPMKSTAPEQQTMEL